MNVKLNRSGIAKRPGRGMAVSNFSYKVPTSSVPYIPYLSGYTLRKSITINNTGNPISLSGHQVVVTMTSAQSDVFSSSMTNGEDIRFTTNDGTTLLNHWIYSYSKAGNTATIYVKVTNVSAFSSGIIYLYYNKPGSVSASSWTNTMQRFEASLSGGTTQYLLGANEGSGASVSNSGSVGGSISIVGTSPTWQSTNAYGQTGTVPRLNGTNNYILIPTLLDTWPSAGEISFTFRVNTLPTGGDNIALIEKFNRIGTTNPDLGDKFSVIIRNVGTNVNYVRFQKWASSLTTPASSINYTGYNTDDPNQINITVGSTHTVTVVWAGGSMGFFLDGLFAGRTILYSTDGHGSDFTIGARRSQTVGTINGFSNVDIQDFRYTDYTSGQEPRLPQIEAEHIQTRFIQKDARTKMSVNRYLIATNIKGRNGRLISASDASNPAYYTPQLEPVILYDTDDNKFKIWYNDLFGVTNGQVVSFYYREASTLAGLASAAEVTCTKSGTNYPQRLTIYKENGTFYLFYSNRTQVGSSAAPIYRQTSTDGKNFTTETTAVATVGSGFGAVKGWENTGAIFKISSTYYMLIECLTTDGVNEIGLVSSSSINGSFTVSGTNPIEALEYGSTLNSGGPSSRPILINGSYYFMYHSRPNTSVIGLTIYDELVLASTSNYTSFTKYTGGYSGVIGRAFDDIMATDQFADPDWTTDGNKVQFAYNAVQNQSNTNFFGTVQVGEFDGAPAQFITDLTLSIQ